MIRNRINTAFARGGHELLCAALQSVGLQVDHSVCVRREAVERAFDGVSLSVPVKRPIAFWYPLDPLKAIEDGRKRVEFHPPTELLSGERIHQWLGARRGIGRPTNDLDRIRRQQVFVRALLQTKFDFGRTLADPELVRVSDPTALQELRTVRGDWHFDCMDDVVGARIEGMSVLVLLEPPEETPESARTDDT
jgi:anionic cell wall polymer biosynthesis LytR-Cps2A-Psr (LCP) family protein